MMNYGKLDIGGINFRAAPWTNPHNFCLGLAGRSRLYSQFDHVIPEHGTMDHRPSL